MKISRIIVVGMVIFLTAACSFNVSLPKVRTGEEKIFTFNQPIPEKQTESVLEIEMGAGLLNISAGSDKWFDGEIRYNVSIWEPKLENKENGFLLHQRTSEAEITIPEGDIINQWSLRIGDHPTDLIIKAGAYQGNLNLSGIPLTGLSIKDGASQSTVVFEKPNPVEMDLFSYQTGASKIELLGLANTNAETMVFQSGSGSSILDFSGKIQRDMEITVEFGLGDVEIIVPKNTPVYARVNGGLNNVELNGTWNISGNEYSIDGKGPKLTFNINVGVGNLKLTNK